MNLKPKKQPLNALHVALTKTASMTEAEKRAECELLCGTGLHSLLCPVLHDQWKQTQRQTRRAA